MAPVPSSAPARAPALSEQRDSRLARPIRSTSEVGWSLASELAVGGSCWRAGSGNASANPVLIFQIFQNAASIRAAASTQFTFRRRLGILSIRLRIPLNCSIPLPIPLAKLLPMELPGCSRPKQCSTDAKVGDGVKAKCQNLLD